MPARSARARKSRRSSVRSRRRPNLRGDARRGRTMNRPLLVVAFLGFSSMAMGATPKGWLLFGSHPEDYDAALDKTVVHGGKASCVLKSKSATPNGFGALGQVFKP